MRNQITILLFIMVIVGCTSTNKALTIEQVIKAFQNEGLQLTEADKNVDNVFQQGLNGVIPEFFHRPIDFVKHKSFEINNVLMFYVYGKNQRDEIDRNIKAAIKNLN